jgi:hypothetical protein
MVTSTPQFSRVGALSFNTGTVTEASGIGAEGIEIATISTVPATVLASVIRVHLCPSAVAQSAVDPIRAGRLPFTATIHTLVSIVTHPIAMLGNHKRSTCVSSDWTNKKIT